MPDEAQEPILAKPVRSALLEWLTEIWAAEDLEAVGLKPRRRAMFHGAPGTGKTTLAHHLAARLGLPMVAIRPDRIIDCWLGSTGRNLGALFDLASPEAEGPCILFFDEFEALGAKRVAGARNAEQERNSVVDTLLQRIEAHPGFIIAATNHGDHLDPAIWRRFDVQIKIDVPGQVEREHILRRYLAPYGLRGNEVAALAEAFETASPALMRQFCEALKRNLVIGDRLGWDMRRAATFDRILAAIEPHPDLGRPRLWALGASDKAVGQLSWPMPLADSLTEAELQAERVSAPVASGVLDFPGRKRAGSQE